MLSHWLVFAYLQAEAELQSQLTALKDTNAGLGSSLEHTESELDGVRQDLAAMQSQLLQKSQDAESLQQSLTLAADGSEKALKVHTLPDLLMVYSILLKSLCACLLHVAER